MEHPGMECPNTSSLTHPPFMETEQMRKARKKHLRT